MASETDKRITELEIRVAYLEQALTEISDAAIAQSTTLETLRERLERTNARLEALLSGAAVEHAP